ncbi:hypothetical protein CO174_00425 [Candidatus Uhrbacteria bacterium CG_4_9_14_3_um_filter_50_9]|uniref:Uncharacterized protein n=1 Tax=Candidatus Uhrbacteria bacterium CG_4_9_14_3_um_filter_50_9 TaxID=1975035 RepID=A0A2M7XEF7_9BACT|nr:MAG: hypothetical protein CO174_00425 [Candidatus Uhrbacteria bacterium CG_4_9_14_3_um_filter_50_9]
MFNRLKRRLLRWLEFDLTEDELNKSPRYRVFTARLTGQDQASRTWAADRWTTSNGSTYVRVCYVVEELINDDFALRIMQRHFNGVWQDGDRYYFQVVMSDSDDTPDCLIDDAVNMFPPQLLITRRAARLLTPGEISLDDYMEGDYTD